MRRVVLLCSGFLLVGAAVLAAGYRAARAMPVVRRAAMSLADWPAGAAPVTVALISDIHIGNATTDTARFAAIARQVSALKPDLIVIAGDFIAGHDREDAASATNLLAGLRQLRSPLGIVAVLGNHDYWTDPKRVRRVLDRGGVTVLANGAVRRGPLAIGGVDDMITQHASLSRTFPAMEALGGAKVLVSHSPDIAPQLTVGGLVLAGHTHCGQIVLPWYGSAVKVSRLGDRYRCGVVREGERTTVITAGAGTSVLPLRYGAPADVWLLRLRPRAPAAVRPGKRQRPTAV